LVDHLTRCGALVVESSPSAGRAVVAPSMLVGNGPLPPSVADPKMWRQWEFNLVEAPVGELWRIVHSVVDVEDKDQYLITWCPHKGVLLSMESKLSQDESCGREVVQVWLTRCGCGEDGEAVSLFTRVVVAASHLFESGYDCTSMERRHWEVTSWLIMSLQQTLMPTPRLSIACSRCTLSWFPAESLAVVNTFTRRQLLFRSTQVAAQMRVSTFVVDEDRLLHCNAGGRNGGCAGGNRAMVPVGQLVPEKLHLAAWTPLISASPGSPPEQLPKLSELKCIGSLVVESSLSTPASMQYGTGRRLRLRLPADDAKAAREILFQSLDAALPVEAGVVASAQTSGLTLWFVIGTGVLGFEYTSVQLHSCPDPACDFVVDVCGWYLGVNHHYQAADHEFLTADKWLLTGAVVAILRGLDEQEAGVMSAEEHFLCPECTMQGCVDVEQSWMDMDRVKRLVGGFPRGTERCGRNIHDARAVDFRSRLLPCDKIHVIEPLPTRRSLVIGVDKYLRPKAGCVRSAENLDVKLAGLQFFTTIARNVAKEEFEAAVEKFAKSCVHASLMVFHFVGHGFVINGAQYLAPSDGLDGM
jgi:hypothetical protein